MSDTMHNVRRTASQSVTMFKSAAGLGANRTPSMPEPANAAPMAPARPDPTVLSANTEITGSIATSDDLHILGKIEGNVRASSITVFAGGRIKGDLTAETINIHGEVEGHIEGAHVRMHAGAAVKGEVVHGSLGIDTAAIFEGSIKRIAAPAAE